MQSTTLTKGKVESGVKYFKGNFLPGREFVDEVHLHEQLAEWMTTIADVRIHGTTHERPIDRFAQEQTALLPTGGQPSFRLEAPLALLRIALHARQGSGRARQRQDRPDRCPRGLRRSRIPVRFAPDRADRTVAVLPARFGADHRGKSGR